jgi:NTE family protein
MRQLRKQLKSGSREATRDEILLLSYRPGSEEPGLEKSFELSNNALAQRWRAGFLDMQHSGQGNQGGGITVVRRPEDKD